MLKNMLGAVEDQLNFYLVKQAPALPTGLKEFTASILPWLAIVFAIYNIYGLLLLVIVSGLDSFFITFVPLLISSYSSLARFGYNTVLLVPTGVLSLIISLVVSGMALIAPPGLVKRKRSGWVIIFYASLLYFVQKSLVSVVMLALINIGISFLLVLLALYLLFQIREYYK